MLLVGQALDCELQWEAWQNGATRKYFEGSVQEGEKGEADEKGTF